MSAVSALRQRRNKKAEKEQSRNFSRQQFQAELHCNMRRRAGRVEILDKRRGILNHVRIPGSDWSNSILHCDCSVFILGVSFLDLYSNLYLCSGNLIAYNGQRC